MKRFDKGHIYSTLISAIFSSLIVLFFFSDVILDEEFLVDSTSEKIAVIAAFYLLIYIVRVVFAILYVRFSGYELTATEIRTKTGVISRKSSVLSYTKIHAVNKKQTLFQRIFGVATLTVDSGATGNAFSAEITIIERADEVDKLMAKIKCLQAGEVYDEISSAAEPTLEKENLYSFSSRLKLVYSALTVGGGVFIIVILAVVAAFVLAIATAVLRYAPEQSPSELWFGALFLTVLALILTSIISLIAGICTSFFTYHGFKLHKNRDDLELSHGFFTRHTNNFKYKRIKAVKIMEGPVKRLFGYAEAGLEVVGYGTESSSDSSDDNNSAAPGMLLPLVKAKKLDATLKSIMPEYVPDKITHRAKSYRAFVLFPALYAVIGYTAALVSVISAMLISDAPESYLSSAVIVYAGAVLVNLLFILAVKALEYKNSGIALGNGKLTVQNGAFIRRRTVILMRDVIGIERIATPMREKRGICSYNIHFFANAMTNTVTVRCLDASVGAALEAMLED